MPGIVGTITTPTMRRDGSILTDPGFDPATRLYHCVDPDLHMPPIGTSRADAERALVRLVDLITGFPFVTEVDRSVALSGLISPCVRGAVGTVPAHAFSAPTAGTGKSHLVDVAAAIVTGRICPVATAARNEEETEKRLGGLLLAGFRDHLPRQHVGSSSAATYCARQSSDQSSGCAPSADRTSSRSKAARHSSPPATT